ncbi:hypothetical protein DL96DRAFT_1474288 [Flagelloscypha sp. PMI_526]|nr:hypothetical protein DL96DRAFT_1474288 [Flagelloscypha sp. PMI_526]
MTNQQENNEEGGTRTRPQAPTMVIRGQAIKNRKSITLLGVTIDEKMNWKEQEARAIGRGETWLLQFRRLAKVTRGVSAKYLRRIYISVLLPRLTYAADVWYTPPLI